MSEKVRENRARRAAERQGVRLVKSRRRDPRALDYGRYWFALAEGAKDRNRDLPVPSPARGFTLDEIEALLKGEQS
jgi:hypothetical protein